MEKNTTLLIITALFPPEPLVSAHIVYDIAMEMTNRYNVIVLSPSPSRPYGIIYSNNRKSQYPFTHLILKSFTSSYPNILGRLRESISFGVKCKEYINKNNNKIDVIYQNSWPLFAQYIVIMVAKKYGIPVVTHVDDIYPESFIKKLPNIFSILLQSILLPIDRYILRNSAFVISLSKRMKKYLCDSRRIDQKKVKIIHNWQEEELFNSKFKESVLLKANKPFTFMYAGSINPSACVDILIKSFIFAAIPDSKLIIAGNGSEKKKCMNIVEESKRKNIEFINLSRENIRSIQSEANVLILALRKGLADTATPSKFTAYTLSGKPILAAVNRDSDIADLIEIFKCGVIAKPENIESISTEMKFLSNIENDVLEKIGANAKKLSETVLSREANMNILKDTIFECIESIK